MYIAMRMCEGESISMSDQRKHEDARRALQPERCRAVRDEGGVVALPTTENSGLLAFLQVDSWAIGVVSGFV